MFRLTDGVDADSIVAEILRSVAFVDIIGTRRTWENKYTVVPKREIKTL